MKVLHLEFGRYVYGGALQVVFLIKGLTALAGVESHLACPQGSSLPDYLPDHPETLLHKLQIGGEADPRLYFQLNHLVRTVRPDLIHIHSRRGADLWGPVVARRQGIPFILTRRVDNRKPRWLARWHTRKAAYVVGISRKIRDVMADCGVDPGKLKCIHSTVDTETYRPGGDRKFLAAVAGIDPADPVVGTIAQLIARKGHSVLFEAIPDVLRAHPRTKFLVLGRGPLQRKLESRVSAAPWKESVRFLGFREDLPRLLPAMDIIAHPAFMEGLGVALLQASACGVPIVGSRVGGIPEVVRHGENGFLIDPGDSQGLAGFLIDLLTDADLRARMGQRGRLCTETEFSIPQMVQAYQALYLSALNP